MSENQKVDIWTLLQVSAIGIRYGFVGAIQSFSATIRSFDWRVLFLAEDIPDEGANTLNVALLIKANLT